MCRLVGRGFFARLARSVVCMHNIFVMWPTLLVTILFSSLESCKAHQATSMHTSTPCRARQQAQNNRHAEGTAKKSAAKLSEAKKYAKTWPLTRDSRTVCVCVCVPTTNFAHFNLVVCRLFYEQVCVCVCEYSHWPPSPHSCKCTPADNYNFYFIYEYSVNISFINLCALLAAGRGYYFLWFGYSCGRIKTPVLLHLELLACYCTVGWPTLLFIVR